MKQRDALALPPWLSGQTLAIVSTVLTVGVGIGTMVFSSTSSIRDEISGIRDEMSGIRDEISGNRSGISGIRGEVDGLATKLEDTHESLAAEIKATRLELREEIKSARLELSSEIEGLDARLRAVEQTVAGIQARLATRHPAAHGAGPSSRQVDDVDA